MRKARVLFFICMGLLALALLLPRPATAAWPVDPLVNVPLCAAFGDQLNPAIAAWVDCRNGGASNSADIYAQSVEANGELGSALSVPAEVPLAFALESVRPNPSCGGALTVHFSLPARSPATIELLDVAGRRIASREVGAGQHTLDLGEGQHLSPGLYLVRLTQGANARATRVAVLR
jgi:hypothetical protein